MVKIATRSSMIGDEATTATQDPSSPPAVPGTHHAKPVDTTFGRHSHPTARNIHPPILHTSQPTFTCSLGLLTPTDTYPHTPSPSTLLRRHSAAHQPKPPTPTKIKTDHNQIPTTTTNIRTHYNSPPKPTSEHTTPNLRPSPPQHTPVTPTTITSRTPTSTTPNTEHRFTGCKDHFHATLKPYLPVSLSFWYVVSINPSGQHTTTTPRHPRPTQTPTSGRLFRPSTPQATTSIHRKSTPPTQETTHNPPTGTSRTSPQPSLHKHHKHPAPPN